MKSNENFTDKRKNRGPLTEEQKEVRRKAKEERQKKRELEHASYLMKKKYAEFLDRPEWSERVDKDAVISFLKEALELDRLAYITEYKYLDRLAKQHDYHNHNFWIRSETELMKDGVAKKQIEAYDDFWKRHKIMANNALRNARVLTIYKMMCDTPCLRYDLTQYSRLN